MLALTLFQFYRRFLLLVAMTYSAVKFVNFVWRWRLMTSAGGKPQQVLYRYLEVSVLRTRLRRFWIDFVQIGVLGAVLAWIVTLHLDGSG